MSWIHIDDIVGLFLLALDRPDARGPINGTAPEPARNGDFSRALAKALHRPFLPIGPPDLASGSPSARRPTSSPGASGWSRPSRASSGTTSCIPDSTRRSASVLRKPDRWPRPVGSGPLICRSRSAGGSACEAFHQPRRRSLGVRRRLGLGDRPLVDFSSGINPLGPPARAIEAAREALGAVDRHPEPGCPRLVERLAAHHGIPADRVIVGAGTTELIGLIGQSLREVLAFHAQALGDPSRPAGAPGRPDLRRVSPGLEPQRAAGQGLGRARPRLGAGRLPRGGRRDLLDRPAQQPDRPGLGPGDPGPHVRRRRSACSRSSTRRSCPSCPTTTTGR